MHRVWESVLPTKDPWAFWIPPESNVKEASGRIWHSDYPVVGIFWPQRFYQVFLLLKETGAGYYCNVITPPRYNAEANAVEFVDLDLDVLKMDGKVWVADEEEFAARSPSYPQCWIPEAQGAKGQLLREAIAQTGPFSLRTAEKWKKWRALSLYSHDADRVASGLAP